MQVKYSQILLSIIRFPKRWIIYCLLLAITLQSATQGVVLCFEGDGRIEVEFGSKWECCQAFKWAAKESSTFISSEQDYKDYNSSCGICVDVPLYITAEKKHNTESINSDQFTPLLHKFSYDSAIHINQSSLKNYSPSIPTTSFYISTIQTVILQI